MDENKLSNLRFKTLITIFVVIFIIGGARTYDDIKRNNEIISEKSNETNIAIKNSYSQKIKNIKELISFNGELLSSSPKVKELIKDRKREDLYNLSLPYFSLLKKVTSNQNIRIHYHLPNHKSFLRVHKKELFDDNLEYIRPMISETIFLEETLSGFEHGKHDISQITYRKTFPIFNNENLLIAVLEIGIDFSKIVADIEKEFEENDKKVYIVQRMKEGILNFDNFENYALNINQCLYKKSEIVTPILKAYAQTNKNQVEVDENTYSLVFDEIKIRDYNNNQIGSFVYIIDITKDILQNKKFFYISLSKPIVAVTIILIFIYFIFQYLFNQIKKIENRNKNILNAQKTIIILTNGEELLDCNQALLDFYGYKTVDDFIKINECICNTFEEKPSYLQKYNDGKLWIDYIMDNKGSFFKVAIKDKNKNENIFAISLSKFSENSNKRVDKVYYVATLTNISELENVNLQLIEQSKQASLGEMMGNIAHQWRQPLSTISTVTSSVKLFSEMDTLKKDDLHEKMDIVIERTNYLSETIEIFRNFLKEKKVKRVVFLQDRLDMALSIVDASLRDNHIKLINKIDYKNRIENVMVVGELSQVVINILNNAKDILIEKKIKNPEIIISLIDNEDKALITIEDNAGGVPEEILPKIFEPYFTTKHKTQGTGLGLHMSYKIVTESLNGKLYVKNLKNGAKFYIEIPIKSF